MSDIQRLLNSLIELNATVTEENPAFLPEVDLHSLLTLLVENLFAKMRGGSTDTPQRTSWRVTLSRGTTVSGSSRTFYHSILPNLAARTRLLCHKEFSSIQFHAKM
ncbi:unnamed protein product [Porites evermanni]|uniref:Uncharacterized protein n=1 Tax=Porites evermanni TaxID=104178 RepID=A0ABN8T4J8_9CNID|nr:unnamed protein product [Porites evermanni]